MANADGTRGSGSATVRPPTPDYGDEIRIRPEAPEKFRPGARAWVVGFRTITERDESQSTFSLGSRLVNVEFEDGSSTEVPAQLIVLEGNSRDPDVKS
jgi:hypothetical protein